jgi:hypothetical protein
MRLKQVLINLLSNAIKYNRSGGTVVVECDVTITQPLAHQRQGFTGDGFHARAAGAAVSKPSIVLAKKPRARRAPASASS